MSWGVFDPADAGSVPEDENLAALAAALRPVRASLEVVALRALTAPGWQPGGGAEHAAFVEGQKVVWRLLMRLSERTST